MKQRSLRIHHACAVMALFAMNAATFQAAGRELPELSSQILPLNLWMDSSPHPSPLGFLFTGVRPSSAAATSAGSNASVSSKAPAMSSVSAPEDGRTPLNTYPLGGERVSEGRGRGGLATATGTSATIGLKGVLLTPAQADSRALKKLVSDGYNTAVLFLDERDAAAERRAAARRIQSAGLNLCYWIEIGRNPKLADSHPEWMASLQTHPEWRRHFPDFPQPATNQVVKNYPWVPVLYQETFDVHRQRVVRLLQGLPSAQRVFLNDLQGAPSACGCGNNFCRWTADYGPITTATRLANDAAAKFIAAVGGLMPPAKVIPVWTTECAEHDGPKGAACDGVGCFSGRCWKDYSAQLMPVAEVSPEIGVLLPFRDFPSGRSRTGGNAEWQKYALNSFTEILPKRGGQAIPQNRLIAVLQGWNVSAEQQRQQIRQSEQAGVAGYVVALAKIEQRWEPRLFTPKEHSPKSGRRW